MWLDTLPECRVDADGTRRVGLQLILLHTGIDSERYDNITGGPCMNWRRAQGTRIMIHREGVKFLYNYFKHGKKTLYPIPKQLHDQNKEWLHQHRRIYETPNNRRRIVYPQIDQLDRYLIQKGLNGNVWADFPSGIPGVYVDYSDPFESEEAWLRVTVTKDFNQFTYDRYAHLLPCQGILTWDNSVCI